ncbi:MAG: carboxypeptidase-like regulatory domain-containing protein, partial [Hymenobacter sp.]
FRAGQLAVALVPPASASRWRSWLGAVLAVGGMLGASRAAAQAASPYYSGGPVPTVASPGGVAATAPLVAPATPAAPANPGEPVVLQGVVADAQTGEHLPGVTVLLKGTQQGISTDKDGQFALSIPAGDVATATITFSYIGYITAEMPAARVAATPVVAIQLSAHMLGGLELIYVQKPWPWHPRRFFNWGKYWLTKPFRE